MYSDGQSVEIGAIGMFREPGNAREVSDLGKRDTPDHMAADEPGAAGQTSALEHG